MSGVMVRIRHGAAVGRVHAAALRAHERIRIIPDGNQTGHERDHGVMVETAKPEVARPPLYSSCC